MVKVTPIQTGTVRVKQFQLTGGNIFSRFYQLLFTNNWSEWMPIYCFLIDTGEKRILIDVGETADIYQEGYLPKGGLYHKAVQTRIKEEEEIPHRLARHGLKPSDIQTIILSHMHGDHIGGLKYFEHAEILVSQAEYEMARGKKGPGAGYFKQNWPEWFSPKLISYADRREGVFNQSHTLDSSESIVIVPTPGHSIGHQSVIVKDGDQSWFIGVDLTYSKETLDAEIPSVVLMNKEAKESVKRVKEYVNMNNCKYLSAHS